MSTKEDETPFGNGVEREIFEDARDVMLMALAVFSRWEERLQRMIDGLPSPEYADETGDPLNLSAAIQGLLAATLADEVRETASVLRRAVAWIEDPSEWGGPPKYH